MLKKSIRNEFESRGCTISQPTTNDTRIDCKDFEILKVKGRPWEIKFPYRSIENLASRYTPPFPTKKVSVGFWETLGSWGKIKDLKISDEIFIDIEKEQLKQITDPSIMTDLNRVEKLQALQLQTDVKNIDLKRAIEDRAHRIAKWFATQVEETYEKRNDAPVVCEPETIITNKWLPTKGTDVDYSINIVCVIPYLSETLREKLLDLGDWNISRNPRADFTRSIFPFKDENIYVNEVVFHDVDATTPHINLILDSKALKNKELVPRLRSILHEESG